MRRQKISKGGRGEGSEEQEEELISCASVQAVVTASILYIHGEIWFTFSWRLGAFQSDLIFIELRDFTGPLFRNEDDLNSRALFTTTHPISGLTRVTSITLSYQNSLHFENNI